MSRVVLDASAVLAFLRREPGLEVVREHLRGGLLSAVNYSEVLARAVEIGIDLRTAERVLNRLGVERVPFDDAHAAAAATLRALSREYGLSLADRACLALGSVERLAVLTADRRWADLPVELDVRLIR